MLISIKNLASSFENVNKDPAAFLLAQDIERLADILDPYGYRDYVDETHGGDISASVNCLYNEIVKGNTEYIIEWLAENAVDVNNSRRDRERALNRLFRLYDYNESR